jgi:hypothetical protein
MFMVTRMKTRSKDDFRTTSSIYSHEAKRYEAPQAPAARRIEIAVVFTDAPGGFAGMQLAVGLAQQLGACLKLFMPYEVHYSLPLEAPPVMREYLESQLHDLAAMTGMKVEAQVCLCRDKKIALNQVLPPNSLIIVGGTKRWWPTPAQKLAQALEADGHHVIFAEQR